MPAFAIVTRPCSITSWIAVRSRSDIYNEIHNSYKYAIWYLIEFIDTHDTAIAEHHRTAFESTFACFRIGSNGGRQSDTARATTGGRDCTRCSMQHIAKLVVALESFSNKLTEVVDFWRPMDRQSTVHWYRHAIECHLVESSRCRRVAAPILPVSFRHDHKSMAPVIVRVYRMRPCSCWIFVYLPHRWRQNSAAPPCSSAEYCSQSSPS